MKDAIAAPEKAKPINALKRAIYDVEFDTDMLRDAQEREAERRKALDLSTAELAAAYLAARAAAELIGEKLGAKIISHDHVFTFDENTGAASVERLPEGTNTFELRDMAVRAGELPE